jgi:transposase
MATPHTSVKNGPAALRQVRESAQAMLREGKAEETLEYVLSALESVLTKTQELELLVAKLRRGSWSTKSERMDPAQLSLLLDVMRAQGGTPVEAPETEAKEDAQLTQEIAAAERARAKAADATSKPERGTWSNRGAKKQSHRSAVPESDRACRHCGQSMKVIGEDVTRRLEYVPGHFVEHEHQLEKLACGQCKEGVTTAPAPPQVLERSAVGASLLAHVVVSKFVDHTPLHRLHRIYARSGADIPVSTLSDWVAGAGKLVVPLVERLSERIRLAYLVRTDATGLPVLDPDSPGNIQRGSIWAVVGDDRDVLFRYTPTGAGATGPWEFLAGRKGYIQADAASVFDRLFNGKAASAVEIGCWSHARRRLVALQDTDCRVAYPLKLIARLYRIEHLADAQGVPADKRAEMRKARASPILEKLKQWFVATAASEPPSSDIAKAAAYCLNHWAALTRFVEDGRVGLDNNLCEQQLRDIALGRKNYLFAGSHDAARRTAALYSLMRTCAQYRVPPLPYFTDVLAKLGAGWPVDQLDQLLPHAWTAPAATSTPNS